MALQVKTADSKILSYGTAKGRVIAGDKASLKPGGGKAAMVHTSVTDFFSKNRGGDKQALAQVQAILAKYQ